MFLYHCNIKSGLAEVAGIFCLLYNTPMAHISELLKQATLPTFKVETRKDLLMKFLNRLNTECVATGRKTYHPAFIFTKMKHLDDWDLRIFYASCCEATNFSAYWWWALDAKNARV